MQLTTLNIIKMLPLEASLKQQLLDGWDKMNPDRKFAVEQFIWNTYFSLYNLRLQENMQKGMLRAQENKEQLDAGFFQRMREQTEKELSEEQQVTVTDTELNDVRSKLQQLMGS